MYYLDLGGLDIIKGCTCNSKLSLSLISHFQGNDMVWFEMRLGLSGVLSLEEFTFLVQAAKIMTSDRKVRYTEIIY